LGVLHQAQVHVVVGQADEVGCHLAPR
jgi:hypothetical protein